MLQTATGIALFWGMISAMASCISGYLLAGTGDYDEVLVTTHQWFGISVSIISLLVYLFHRWENGFEKWLVPVLVLLIIITGHLGGSLTHGSDYLFKTFSEKEDLVEKEMKPIADVQEANVFSEIIQPIFESRCYTCHNKSKKKGGLRLDEPSFILKGGKDGKVIMPGNAEESDMIQRLQLPRNDEDHMPPKEKPQLKDNEIALLHWWIATGASFDKKTKELEQPEKIKPVLLALQKQEKPRPDDVPATAVEAANEKTIQQLRKSGAVVLPVARNSNYLSVNFVTVDTVSENDLKLLAGLKKQLIWLKLSDKKITDEMLKTIGQLSNLTRLQLDKTLITDTGLVFLQSLKKLQYLNLVETGITEQGLLHLKELPQLRTIYLYQTKIGKNDWSSVRNQFTKTVLDTGGYDVPFLETDTIVVKPPKK
jgi:mono/diheme cytochrome c family protein